MLARITSQIVWCHDCSRLASSRPVVLIHSKIITGGIFKFFHVWTVAKITNKKWHPWFGPHLIHTITTNSTKLPRSILPSSKQPSCMGLILKKRRNEPGSFSAFATLVNSHFMLVLHHRCPEAIRAVSFSCHRRSKWQSLSRNAASIWTKLGQNWNFSNLPSRL